MRVVAGTARGRRLVVPAGTSIRPTGDRAREATFNALASLAALEGATVLDLFAGSGALGIEALSRGAQAATFVDDDPSALTAVRANLEATGLTERATVVRADGRVYLATAPAWDLALLDPPYALDDRAWSGLLASLRAGLVVLESDRNLDVGPEWRVFRVRRYSSTVVTFARPRDAKGPR